MVEHGAGEVAVTRDCAAGCAEEADQNVRGLPFYRQHGVRARAGDRSRSLRTAASTTSTSAARRSPGSPGRGLDADPDRAALLAEALERAATLPHRERYLQLVHRLGELMLDTHEQWLADVREELSSPRK